MYVGLCVRVLLGCGFSCGLSSLELEQAWRFVVLGVLSEFPPGRALFNPRVYM